MFYRQRNSWENEPFAVIGTISETNTTPTISQITQDYTHMHRRTLTTHNEERSKHLSHMMLII